MYTAGNNKNNFALIVKYSILIGFSVMCIYPLIWVILNSFKTNEELFANPWGLPLSFSLVNYIHAFSVGNIARYFVNSVFVTVISVTISVLLSAMAAYGITRLKWRLSGFVLSLFLLGMMIPTYAAVVPLFSMFNKMGIINTYAAVIIPHITFSFPISIFILSGFLVSVPREIEEAAVIDGCSLPGAFFKVICPILLSAIVTVAVINFLGIWNDLLFPQIFLSDPKMMTLPVGLTAFKGRYSTNYVSMIAAVVITVIPSIIVYSILHEKIMEGMTAGAVKG